MAQVGSITSTAKLLRQRSGEMLEELGAVLRSCGSSLLEFDNVSADLPAGLHLNGVGHPEDLLPRTLDELAKC